MKTTVSIVILFVLSIVSVYAQKVSVENAGTITDSRDGQVYEIASYARSFPNGQGYSYTWMTKNLNYEMDGSFCYNDSISNCEIYGRLYTWDAANKACPEGWHLPSDEEWYLLSFLFGGNCASGDALKSKSTLWEKDSYGTNKSLFNAVPSGTGVNNEAYFSLGNMAIFWSSDVTNEDRAWDWKLKRDSELQRWYASKETTNCVRCVKD